MEKQFFIPISPLFPQHALIHLQNHKTNELHVYVLNKNRKIKFKQEIKLYVHAITEMQVQ